MYYVYAKVNPNYEHVCISSLTISNAAALATVFTSPYTSIEYARKWTDVCEQKKMKKKSCGIFAFWYSISPYPQIQFRVQFCSFACRAVCHRSCCCCRCIEKSLACRSLLSRSARVVNINLLSQCESARGWSECSDDVHWSSLSNRIEFRIFV